MADKYNCIKCKYGITTDDYEHCGNCDNGSEFVKMSNSDRIRAMSDEELAEFLVNFENTFGEEYEGEMSCLDWLQSEAE